ncbi:MAG: molybdenum cofactor biosynthesis protein MoaE [Candidatus Abyssobacteria bacterium SURF_17]|jgi:molybdopterin synthase catalytic subunit|uniref:Molybdopterin synthase catalytic subunit n=1 Tax=Candidatus Abyssobacteria bacterium SURF_17 TaxID=2093361 RepID=A0A419EXK4_9BACT|nr:MAG: molybdenum cofactor biosynthesis protein MoaE [Candidatus Abyssubacteria bacterium SURF_17]
MIEITDKALDPRAVYDRLSHEAAGSVVVHIGVVKPVAQGRRTRGIRFAPKGDLAGELRSMEADLRSKWKLTDALLFRRVGELAVGDIILISAVSAPDREAAFDACREAVERFKRLECMQKQELYEESETH